MNDLTDDHHYEQPTSGRVSAYPQYIRQTECSVGGDLIIPRGFIF